MASVLLVNPRKRRKARKSGGKSRRRNPVSRTVRRSRKNRRHHVKGYYPNPARRSRARHRRRRNPISLPSLRTGNLVSQFMDALTGAGGAIVNDAAFTYIPLPSMLKTGPMSLLTRALGAFGVGYLASFVGGREIGKRMAEGALTVLAYNTVKPMVATVMPLAGSEIDGLGYYSPGLVLQNTLSPLTPLNQGTPLNAYISGADDFSSGYDGTIDAYIS